MTTGKPKSHAFNQASGRAKTVEPRPMNAPSGYSQNELGARRALVADLFKEHNRSLIGFLRMRLPSEQDARDIAQEAYVKLLQLDQPEEVNFLKAYLYKIASNLAIDHVRRQNTRNKAAQDVALFEFSQNPMQEKAVNGRQELLIVKKAVAELPPKCRQAFLLSRSGWSSVRIGAHMSVSDRMVRNYLRRSLEHLQHRLAQAQTPLPGRAANNSPNQNKKNTKLDKDRK